ncbi:MAG: COX15/CtaA family protein [bacterium]|nr:COX15/CtaA family protein [bacterium]
MAILQAMHREQKTTSGTNPFMVQFIHRWLGALIFIGVWVLFAQTIRHKLNHFIAIHYFGLALLTTCQYMLGVFTLLFKVPLPLALMHQGLGAILLGVMVMIVFDLRHMKSIQ